MDSAFYCRKAPLGDERFTIGPAIVRMTPLNIRCRRCNCDIRGLRLHLFELPVRLLWRPVGRQERFALWPAKSPRPNGCVLGRVGDAHEFCLGRVARGVGKWGCGVVPRLTHAAHGARAVSAERLGPCGRRWLQICPAVVHEP